MVAGAVETGPTFADAATEWLRYVVHDRKRRPSTLADYRGVVNHALVPEFGDFALETITPERIDTYRARLVDEGRLSPRTINKRLVIMHGILRRAMRVYGLRTNPSALVDRQPLRRSGEFAVLHPAEIDALGRAAKNDQDAALFRVPPSLDSGSARSARSIGPVSTSSSDSSTSAATSRTAARGRRSRGACVSFLSSTRRRTPSNALSRRERFTGDDDLVFVDEVGRHVDDRRLRRRFHDALERAGLPRLRLHDLRHTFRTLAVRAFPLSDVKACMGHADIATTMVHVHHVPQPDAAERLSRLSPRPNPCHAFAPFRDTLGTRTSIQAGRTTRKPARLRGFRHGPAWIRTHLLIALFLRAWVHRWGHAVRTNGHV